MVAFKKKCYLVDSNDSHIYVFVEVKQYHFANSQGGSQPRIFVLDAQVKLEHLVFDKIDEKLFDKCIPFNKQIRIIVVLTTLHNFTRV